MDTVSIIETLKNQKNQSPVPLRVTTSSAMLKYELHFFTHMQLAVDENARNRTHTLSPPFGA